MLDLFFSRYNDPMSLIDGLLETGGLSDFIRNAFQLEDERKHWEMYLHKYKGQESYPEFRQMLRAQNETVTAKDVGAIISASKNICSTVHPGGDEK